MENDDTSNLFKDFKYPDDPKGISKAPKPRPLMEEQASEEDRIKMGYKKAEQSLEEKSRKNTARHLKAKTMPNYERIAYIAIILVLGAYISIDFGFYHGSNDIAGSADEKLATGAAIKLGGKGNASKDTASVNISKNAAASARPIQTFFFLKEIVIKELYELSAILTSCTVLYSNDGVAHRFDSRRPSIRHLDPPCLGLFFAWENG